MPKIMPSQVVAFIDQFYPPASKPSWPDNEVRVGPDHAPHLAGIVAMIEWIPNELLQISGKDFSDLLMGTAGLKNAVETWTSRGQVDVKLSVGHDSHVTMIRRALAKCPDEAPAPGTADLAFLESKELRDDIRADISAANSALHNSEWKGATVLAGAASEALLLWALQSKTSDSELTDALNQLVEQKTLKKPRDNNPDTWSLHDYIELAARLGLIGKDTAIQARLAKNFRNLIHPGRSAASD